MTHTFVWLGFIALAALVPLLIGAPAAPARAVAGSFVTLTVAPALALLALAFFGRRAALGLGAALALLTVGLVVGAPPAIALQETRWRLALNGPDVTAVARLMPPRTSSAVRALESGGRVALYVCLERGEPADVEVRVSVTAVTEVAVPVPAECWKQYAVPVGAISAAAPDGLEATVSGRPGGSAELIGGYTRSRVEGGQSGGGALRLADRLVEGDLSATAPGVQVGRYFVELRFFAVDGRLIEIWY